MNIKNNITLFKKGNIPWNKGLSKKTDKRIGGRKLIPRETRLCICGCRKTFECKINSKKRFISGHNKGHLGKKHTIESKEKNRKSHLGKKANNFAKQNMSIAQIKRRLKRNNLSKPEQILKQFLNENFSSCYKYVGNGEIIIYKYSPDFININGQKKIIELFGCYWHACSICKINNNTEIVIKNEKRLDTYKQYGYETLVIWEHELKNLEKVNEKITNFNLVSNMEIKSA